ncbi:hypothetical protein Q1695_000215 [Nippostrongylus brasiliensis]|nr:hypothetical protein Q1695_000215 [Nippostrongylus brasiliensis]
MSRGDEFVNTMNTSLEDVMDGHRRTKILIVSTADKATKHGRQMDTSRTMKLLEELLNVYGNNTNQWLAGSPATDKRMNGAKAVRRQTTTTALANFTDETTHQICYDSFLLGHEVVKRFCLTF